MPARRARPAPARPRLEEVEDRSVPAALTFAGGVLTYTAAPGEANALTVSVAGANYRFNDAAPITAAPAGWAGAGTPTVSGPTAGVNQIVINLGDRADILNLRAAAADVSVSSTGSLAGRPHPKRSRPRRHSCSTRSVSGLPAAEARRPRS